MVMGKEASSEVPSAQSSAAQIGQNFGEVQYKGCPTNRPLGLLSWWMLDFDGMKAICMLRSYV